MTSLRSSCACIALIALTVFAAGCASDPVVASARIAHGLFDTTGEIAIVTGRTFFYLFGLNIDTTPPSLSSPSPMPAPVPPPPIP